jgi:hypothetical protein
MAAHTARRNEATTTYATHPSRMAAAARVETIAVSRKMTPKIQDDAQNQGDLGRG